MGEHTDLATYDELFQEPRCQMGVEGNGSHQLHRHIHPGTKGTVAAAELQAHSLGTKAGLKGLPQGQGCRSSPQALRREGNNGGLCLSSGIPLHSIRHLSDLCVTLALCRLLLAH